MQTAVQQQAMKRTPFSVILIIVVLLAVLGSMTLAAQDRFTLKVLIISPSPSAL
jgi:hypothetical protein